MENLQAEAREEGMTVIMLANQIVTERKAAEKVVTGIDATLARARNALEVAEAYQITEIVEQGLTEMGN
jgi:hypothetical protein